MLCRYLCKKWLNRSRCRWRCWVEWFQGTTDLGCADGSTSSIVFAWWRQCDLIGGHIDVTWRIRLNSPSAMAMRPYVKLLW